MIQLQFLSGKKAGNRMVVRRFPFNIGRSAENDLPLEDNGVWDRHLNLEFRRRHGFIAKTINANAIALVNNQPIQETRLKNGDVIAIGSVKLQFWLGAIGQHDLRAREFFVWALIAAICAAQIILIYWQTR